MHFLSLSPCSGTSLFCHSYYGKPAPSTPSPSVTPIRMEGPRRQRLLLLLKNWKDSPPDFFFALFFSLSKLPFKYCVRNRVWERSQSWLCKASPSLFYTKFCLTFQPVLAVQRSPFQDRKQMRGHRVTQRFIESVLTTFVDKVKEFSEETWTEV